jgi:type I restriction enzyme S subunit
MTAGLHPYPEYKDSGLLWLDRIPAHWQVLRTKYLFREVDERSKTGEETHLSMSQQHGLIPSSELNGRRLRSESYAGGRLCQTNDLVLNRLKAHLGVFARTRQPGVVSPDYTVLRSLHNDDVVFFELVFKTPACVAEFRCSAKGIVEGFWRLYTDDFYNIRVPVPPVEERDAILRFTRALDAKVRRFIRNRRRLIEVLNEQKQAIINRAVTRGLEPNTPLKPSGIDWLGNIPEHWEISPLKRATELIAGGATPESSRNGYWNGEVVWVTPTDVSKHDVLTDSERRLTQAGLASCSAVVVPTGSIVLTSRAPVGNTAIAAVPLCTNQGCKAIVPDSSRLNSEYLLSQLKVMKPHLQNVATGTTFTEIDTWSVANEKIAIPPMPEQELIVTAVKREALAIDASIRNAQREIDLVREYRTQMIADAVTGKVDVRSVAKAAQPRKANIHFYR